MNRRIKSILCSALTWAAASTLGTCLGQPKFDWARFLTPVNHVADTIDITSDADGNAIVAFTHLPEGFDGNPSTNNVVAKASPSGEVLWSYRLLPSVKGLATDNVGNIYVAGVRLGPGFGPVPSNYFQRVGTTPTGDGTGYLAKLSPDGILQWVRQFGGTAPTNTLANAVVFDAQGHYYIAGQYKAGTTIGGRQLPAPSGPGNWGVYVARFAPQGQVVWVQTGSWTGGTAPNLNLVYRPVRSHGVRLDRHGNLSVRFQQWAPFLDASGLNGAGAYSARFAPDGRLLLSLPTLEEGPGTSDADGSLFTAEFDRQDSPEPAGVLRVRKYNPSGELAWTREARVNSNHPGPWFDHRIVADGAGNCIVGGRFLTPDSFDPGQIIFGDVTLTTIGFSDGFLARYSSAGDLQWAVQSQSLNPAYPGHQYPHDISQVASFLIAPTATGDILFTGVLAGPVAFGDVILEGPTTRTRSLPQFVGRLTLNSGETPALRIVRQANEIVLSWPGKETGFVLETTTSLASSVWVTVAEKATVENSQNVLKLGIDLPDRFYRLRRQ